MYYILNMIYNLLYMIILLMININGALISNQSTTRENGVYINCDKWEMRYFTFYF